MGHLGMKPGESAPHRTVTQTKTLNLSVKEGFASKLFSPEDLEKAEQKKSVFAKLQDWAVKKGTSYEFKSGPSPDGEGGTYQRFLYFGTDLFGIGEGSTQRQAKINCATVALENLEAGKTLVRPCSQNGLIAFLRSQNDIKNILTTDPSELI